MLFLLAPTAAALLPRALIGALALLALLTVSARAHEGHDHGAQPVPLTAGFAARGEASSQLYELVAVAKGGELLLYLDSFATNEPVEGARIEAETPQGPVKAAAKPGAPYRMPAPFSEKPGAYELIFTVSAGENADVLPLTFTVPQDAGAASPSSGSENIGGWLQRAPFAHPFFIGGTSFAAGLILGAALLRRRKPQALALLLIILLSAAPALAHEGHDHAAEKPPASAQATDERAQRLPDGSVFVPKPVQRIFAVRTVLSEEALHARSVELPGRIIPDPNASGYVQSAVGGRLSPPPGGFPRLGAQVAAGDVLGYVTPPLQAIDVSDMRQRQGELDQQISIVERRLARQEQLAPSGAVSRAQLEETRLELQGLKERRVALEKAKREPEALIAPVAGVIADGAPVAGQIVASSAVIFHIVDPAKLWVEALSFHALAGAREASASTAAGKSFTLSYRGAGLAGKSQSIPVHFALEGDTSSLRAGQFVTVLVTTEEEARGIAVPRGSLVRSANGQDFVYEHIAAERFIARAVRTEPLDAERVLIAAGLGPGKRVVSQGAELLDHVR